MKYCSRCCAPVRRKIPDGDHRVRDTCDACGTVFYSNPKIVVGTVLEWEGRILMCRRAIEPGSGLWTLPAGFMENGETTSDGALRETFEEAGVQGKVDGLFSIIDIPAISQVHMFFRGSAVEAGLAPGPETIEADFFDEQKMPWEEIAFVSVAVTLQAYFADLRQGRFEIHAVTLDAHAARQSSRR